MVADIPSRGARRFPEIRINLRTRSVQVGAASAVVAFAFAVGFLAFARTGYERTRADQQAAIARAQTANADLKEQVARLRDRLALAARDRQQATADLDRALSDRDRLRARISELEQTRSRRDFAVRTTGLIETGPSQSAADPAWPEMLISDAPPEPEDQSRSIAQFARQAVAEVRRLLASTGLNVDRLFPQLAQDRGGLGGPFVAPPRADQPNGTTPDKMEELRSFMRSLPLSVPLDYYQLESPIRPAP